MSDWLGLTPAKTTKSSALGRQQIWPEISGKLLQNQNEATAPISSEEAMRAIFASPIFRQEAGLAGAEGDRLDKRDGTLTPAGGGGSALLSSQKPEHLPASSEGVQIRRWRLKHTVANVLRGATPEGGKTPGVCKCGTAARCVDGAEMPVVTFYNRDGRPGVSGVYYCDSPWLCPTCAPRCAAERAERVQKVFDATEQKGGQVVFLTLTVRHRREERLKDLKSLVTRACRKARQGKPWALAVKRHDIQGVLVGPEVTWSRKTGWHFHLHLAVPMIEAATEDETAEELPERAAAAGEWIISRYLSYIRAEGGDVERRYHKPEKDKPSALRKAQDVQVVWRREDLADYLAKGSGAWEVAAAGTTKTRTKNRKIGGMTPWDMAVLAGQGDETAAARFVEYAEVMPGTRSCVITKALADKLGLKPEDDGEEPGVEEIEDNTVIVGELETPRWHRVLRRGYAADVLRAVGDNRPWLVIDDMVRQFLGEPERQELPTLVMRPLPPPPKMHAPSLADLVGEIGQSAVLRFRGHKGRAVQAALDAHRAKADAANVPCLFPSFGEIWQALAA